MSSTNVQRTLILQFAANGTSGAGLLSDIEMFRASFPRATYTRSLRCVACMTEDSSNGEVNKDAHKEMERRAEEIFGLPLCAENGWDPELLRLLIDQHPAPIEQVDPESFSDPWYTRAHDATVVIETGADIARRYASRKLRPGFDVNDVALPFRELAFKLLTNSSLVEALELKNAIWRGNVIDWANQCAAFFAVIGASPLPDSFPASFAVRPFVEVKMARLLVLAWTALGGESLIDFLKEIAKRYRENRDPTGPLKCRVLICQATAEGARTAAEIRDRVEPYLQVKKDAEPTAPSGCLAKLSAQASAEGEKIRSREVLRKTIQRMRKDPGKVRGKARAEHFGFGTFVDGQYVA